MARQRNEGEGNRTAAREFNQAQQRFVKDGGWMEAAEEAARAVSGPDGEELRAAEERTAQRLEPRDIAIPADVRASAARYIDEVLARTYTLMIETQILHWNVKGPLFLAAHELSEQHYKDMFAAVDVIAERNRALGQTSPARSGAFPPPARFSADRVRSEAAIGALCDGHEELVKLLREATQALDEAGDAATADFFTDRLAFHEKAVWMWRALAGSSGSTV